MTPRNVFEAMKMCGGGGFEPAPCDVATNTRPGSPEKKAVLIARLELGVELHSDRDAKLVWEASSYRSLVRDFGTVSNRGKNPKKKGLVE